MFSISYHRNLNFEHHNLVGNKMRKYNDVNDMNIKKTLLWKICKKTYNRFRIRCAKYDTVHEEHMKCFGRDFSDKVFYVIRREGYSSGLFSHFHSVFDHTVYAISRGYIPVVNMENYKIFCNEKKPIEIEGQKTLNAWEYYFEQPCGYSLEDIKKAKNVILSSMGFYSPLRIPSPDPYAGILYPDPFNGKKSVTEYYEFVSKYLRLKSRMIECGEQKKEKLFGNKTNILGCFHRGAGYNASYIKNHPIMPSLEQTLKKAREIYHQEQFEYIFVSTEEHETIEAFCKEFSKEKIIFIERERLKNYNEQQGNDIRLLSKYSSSLFDNALDYLTEVYLLAKCDGLIASKAGGSLFAVGFNNNKYRYLYQFDLGLKT